MLREELDCTIRLLQQMASRESELRDVEWAYAEHIQRLIGNLAQFWDDDFEKCSRTLAQMLIVARMELLEACPDLRSWIGLARYIWPDEKLRVPDRFISEPRKLSVSLNMDALDAALWVQKLYENEDAET